MYLTNKFTGPHFHVPFQIPKWSPRQWRGPRASGRARTEKKKGGFHNPKGRRKSARGSLGSLSPRKRNPSEKRKLRRRLKSLWGKRRSRKGWSAPMLLCQTSQTYWYESSHPSSFVALGISVNMYIVIERVEEESWFWYCRTILKRKAFVWYSFGIVTLSDTGLEILCSWLAPAEEICFLTYLYTVAW